MSEYLKLKSQSCKNCYKCIRHCPVKSINFASDQAAIDDSECILCGQCYVHCPQDAQLVRDDIGAAKALIESGAPVFVSLAPSFVASFEGATLAGMEKALRALGFAGAEETALGATTVKNRYEAMIREGQQDVIISSCCHTVNMLIQKHYPGALPYLAKVVSPMQAHCADIKARHPDARTVFIGPCISKKAEADSYPGAVDCVLTFEELDDWLCECGATIESIPDETPAGKARLFPTNGGILRTMKRERQNDGSGYSYLAVDGIKTCIRALKDICEGSLSNCFIEMSACAGSCIGGPAVGDRDLSPVKRYVTVNNYAGSTDFAVPCPAPGDLVKDMPYLGVRRPMPGSSAIEEVLRQMGKTSPEQELNCGTCGYDTCRDKAVAVLLGKADLTMCLPYLMEKAESFSDTIIKNTPTGIIVLDDALKVQQINGSACRMLSVRYPGDVLGDQVVRILDPQPFVEAQMTGRNLYDKRVYLAEYDRYVEETVILDPGGGVTIVFMRDITEEERHREKREALSQKTIEIADRVIEKQMRTVQEIASLLGETTAEAKIALTHLKETLEDE